MKPCIILIGAQHVGKTTLGKALAEKLGVPFIDTDQEVSRICGIHITKFYFYGGQEGYNFAEAGVGRLLVERFKNKKKLSAVISTGSGFSGNEDGYRVLSQIGTFYWLDGDLEIGAKRIIEEATEGAKDESKKNPLLFSYGKFANLYDYAVNDKVETEEDLRKSYLKSELPTLKRYEKFADVIVRPKDAPVSENLDLLFKSIIWDESKERKVV